MEAQRIAPLILQLPIGGGEERRAGGAGGREQPADGFRALPGVGDRAGREGVVWHHARVGGGDEGGDRAGAGGEDRGVSGNGGGVRAGRGWRGFRLLWTSHDTVAEARTGGEKGVLPPLWGGVGFFSGR